MTGIDWTMCSSSSSWQSLGQNEDEEVFYRKHMIYKHMSWNRKKNDVKKASIVVDDLDPFRVSACGFSGPIALCRNRSKCTILRSKETCESFINIFSSSGNFIRKFNVDTYFQRSEVDGSSGGILSRKTRTKTMKQLITMGWTHDERLVCVFRDGTVRI